MKTWNDYKKYLKDIDPELSKELNIMFQKIEDTQDLLIAEKAHYEYVRTGEKSQPIEKLFEELNINH